MPFAEYADFKDCVDKNRDKADPAAYCGSIKAEVEKDMGRRGILLALTRLAKAGPPGPPPRPGLVWHDETSRWIRPPGKGPKRGDGMMPYEDPYQSPYSEDAPEEHSGPESMPAPDDPTFGGDYTDAPDDPSFGEDIPDETSVDRSIGVQNASEALDYVEADGGVEALQEAMQMLFPYIEDKDDQSDLLRSFDALKRNQFNLNAQEQMRMVLDQIMSKALPGHMPMLTAVKGNIVTLGKRMRGRKVMKELSSILEK